MKAPQLKDLPIKINIRGIVSKTLIDHSDATVKELTLEAHQTIESHNVDVQVLFFILQGSGTININNSSYTVKEESFLHCPKQIPMSITAGVNGLRFLNIKTPGFNPSK